jgi:hypothetical protein
VSIGLQPASVYRYQVRAEFIRDGKPVSEEKTVQLTAGGTESLAFSVASGAQPADIAVRPPAAFPSPAPPGM